MVHTGTLLVSSFKFPERLLRIIKGIVIETTKWQLLLLLFDSVFKPLDWYGVTLSLAGSSLWLLCVCLLSDLWHGHCPCYIDSFPLPHPFLASFRLFSIRLIVWVWWCLWWLLLTGLPWYFFPPPLIIASWLHQLQGTSSMLVCCLWVEFVSVRIVFVVP
mgnify:CR=1 FL=1